jgi:predicted HicB family RNase H-like nuclease
MKKPVAAVSTANVPKKPSNRMNYLGTLAEAPKLEADNMEAVKLRDLNFKVDPEFHTKFKMTATASGKSMKELLEECFAAWVAAHRGHD